MAFPTVAINSTGSDTAASGAGPATALSGVLAATASTATVTITDAVDLSGVAVDGSAALWVSTASGRRWSGITAIAGASGNWTVTVASAYGVTASGQSWGIGGKRATINGSRKLFTDAPPGWTIDVQTGETLAAKVTVGSGLTTAGSWLTVTSTAGTRPLLTTATNGVQIFDLGTAGQGLKISHLAFSNTAVTRAQGVYASAAGLSLVLIDDCTFDGFSIGVEYDNQTNFGLNNAVVITRCEVKNCTLWGVSADTLRLDRCWVHGCGSGGGGGARFYSGTGKEHRLTNTGITDNTGVGVSQVTGGAQAGMFVELVNCTLANNTSDGLRLAATNFVLVLVDNEVYANGGYGVNVVTAGGVSLLAADHNAYGANVTAARNNLAAGASDVAESANPFASASDYALKATAAGHGAAGAAPGLTASPAGDVGAVPSGGAAAGAAGASGRYSASRRG